jgi:hypothetical protein
VISSHSSDEVVHYDLGTCPFCLTRLRLKMDFCFTILEGALRQWYDKTAYPNLKAFFTQLPRLFDIGIQSDMFLSETFTNMRNETYFGPMSMLLIRKSV